MSTQQVRGSLFGYDCTYIFGNSEEKYDIKPHQKIFIQTSVREQNLNSYVNDSWKKSERLLLGNKPRCYFAIFLINQYVRYDVCCYDEDFITKKVHGYLQFSLKIVKTFTKLQ